MSYIVSLPENTAVAMGRSRVACWPGPAKLPTATACSCARPPTRAATVAGTGSGLLLAQRVERRPDLGGEQFGLFPGSEVAAPVDLVEVGEGGVGLLDPVAGGPENLAREDGEADRDADLRRGLSGRAGCGLPVLPVLPGGRSPGAGQPVQRDVVEDLVPGEMARGLAVEEGAGDLVVAVGVVVDHPGRQGDR